jgi:hypothetical protein
MEVASNGDKVFDSGISQSLEYERSLSRIAIPLV